MLRYFLLAILGLMLTFGCHNAKKTTASKPKPKPRPTAPAKKTDPVAAKTLPNKTEEPKKPAPATSAPTSDASSVVFTKSEQLSPVLERAQKEKKVVFVEFSADWCAPCKVMEEEVLSQKPTFTYLNKNFINYKVDFDSPNGKRIASIYEVKSLPTILFLDPKGVVLERKTGIASHTSLTVMGDSAMKKI